MPSVIQKLRAMLDVVYKDADDTDSQQGWIFILMIIAKKAGLRVRWECEGDNLVAVHFFVRGSNADYRDHKSIAQWLKLEGLYYSEPREG
jgi:hypothetical protein